MVSKKTIGKIIGGILLIFFLDAAVTTYSLYQITDESRIKPAFASLVSEQLGGFDNSIDAIRESCISNPGFNITIPGLQVSVACSDIRASDNDGIKLFIASEIFDTIYNRDPGCDVLECVESNPLGLFSRRSHDGFLGLTYILIILSAAAGLLLWLSADKRTKAFGSAFITVGIFSIIYFIIPSVVFGQQPSSVLSFAGLIFSTLAYNHLPFLIAGIVLVAAGFLLRSRD